MGDFESSRPVSKLLNIPYDVRREIYNHLIPPSYHVYFEEGRRRLSPCVLSPVIPPRVSGWERRHNFPESMQDWKDEQLALWARRLQSSWGEHWNCEEAAHGVNAKMASMAETLLQTCEKL